MASTHLNGYEILGQYGMIADLISSQLSKKEEPRADSGSSTMQQMMLMQQQAQQQEALRRAQESASSAKTALYVAGGVGVVSVIGLILWAVLR